MWKCREGNVEVAYRNWGDEEPDGQERENCVALSTRWVGKRRWGDAECGRIEKALCKIAGRPVLHV